jgi:hypothetical protein
VLVPPADGENQELKGKKLIEKTVSTTEGTRKSSRFEKSEDIKVADKAISRAEAKDAFLNRYD